ncbi:MAG: thioredoxin [Chlamydiales bacterium]|nr:thioredoxin [Chlamydiia bacterium]MCP5506937.1 thioredoxin [Chlamydiales bacterium]
MADSNHIKTLDDENFQDTISQGVTLVDFYADWCGPCRMIAPLIEEIAVEMQGKATVGKLDIESSQATPAKYEVHSIPTIIIFKDGQEFKRLVGVHAKEDFVSMINEAV